MKSIHLALVAAVLLALGVPASAQTYPGVSRTVAYDYYSQADAAAPKPAAPPTKPADAAAVPMDAAAPAAEEAAEEEEEECKACELFGTTCNGLHMGGWINAGVTMNEFGPGVPFNGPLSFNDRNEGMVNQVMLFAENKAEAEDCCWDWGYRVELLYGRDALFVQSVGLELDQDGNRKWNNQRFYGVALPSAHLEAVCADWNIKIGKMVTALEYEVINSTGNFFYSHSYGFLYAVPFTHTGVMASYKVNDCVTVIGGLFNGWDKFDGRRDVLAFHFGFTYTPCHEQYKIICNGITGLEPNIQGAYTNRTAISTIFDYKVNDCWQYVLVNDIGWQEANGTVTPGAEWYGLNNYLFKTVNECWKVGGRFEWFRDDDGVRVTGAGPTAGNNVYQGGSPGHFNEVTLGANYTPHANLWVRPEVRYDWYNGIGTVPFNNNNNTDQLSLALDVIVTY